jgi:hypothetical protein
VAVALLDPPAPHAQSRAEHDLRRELAHLLALALVWDVRQYPELPTKSAAPAAIRASHRPLCGPSRPDRDATIAARKSSAPEAAGALGRDGNCNEHAAYRRRPAERGGAEAIEDTH